MLQYELIAPCHFGMEAVLKREIQELGLSISEASDGKVSFLADEEGIARANIFLRTPERILIKVASFRAETFTELFDRTKEIRWEKYLPKDARFWVAKAASIKSKLFSPSDIQSIIKKAIVEELKSVYHTSWFEETGDPYPLRVTIMKDIVTIGLDTSGESLHKRGYRKLVSKAPLAENLAAAMLLLSPWHKDRILVDPFCGSGTIPIEAALIAANIAPGMRRGFTAMKWTNFINEACWRRAVEEAEDLVDQNVDTDIQGYDIDGEIIASARENARAAGVEKLIHLQRRSVAELSHPKKYGFLITNPPYGERLGEKEELSKLYTELGEAYRRLSDWSAYIITGYADVEKYMGRKADKNRKIYNGMMKTYLYQFLGAKPPKYPKATPNILKSPEKGNKRYSATQKDKE
ncbi:MAG: class I SAM-dependent RNA methyltransferase [Lachnospiraceae bacterium]|nr:class I SAM-dependent RNA methyltransferase [Lachnospiraceae bacterium]